MLHRRTTRRTFWLTGYSQTHITPPGLRPAMGTGNPSLPRMTGYRASMVGYPPMMPAHSHGIISGDGMRYSYGVSPIMNSRGSVFSSSPMNRCEQNLWRYSMNKGRIIRRTHEERRENNDRPIPVPDWPRRREDTDRPILVPNWPIRKPEVVPASKP